MPPLHSTPLHLSPRFLALAFLGGAAGTAARLGLSLAFPGTGKSLGIVLAINVLGAFCLGLLLEGLVRRGPDVGARRTVRILVGTGFMGGFTTYSTLATGAVSLGEHSLAAGAGYALATVLLGLAAAGLGVWAAARAVGSGPAVEAEDA